MATHNQPRGLTTRTANMMRRREKILDCAGRMIAEDGLDAMTLAKLADRAGVTIPTIHNLLGKKADILFALVDSRLALVMQTVAELDRNDAIAAVEDFVDRLICLLGTDDILFRAAFIAGERIKYFEQKSASGVFARSLEQARQICQDASARGDLEGRIETDQIAQRLFASQRLARQDWMNGYITLEAYRLQVLTGMYITLCADAAPDFKDRLVDKIEAIRSQCGGQ